MDGRTDRRTNDFNEEMQIVTFLLSNLALFFPPPYVNLALLFPPPYVNLALFFPLHF